MSNELLDDEVLLNEALRQFLLDNKTEFRFAVRKKPGTVNFYAELDLLLRRHPFLKITATRDSKEGFIKVARPSEVGFDVDTLLQHRPLANAIKAELHRVVTQFGFCDSHRFLSLNYNLVLSELENLTAVFEVLQHLLAHRGKVRGLYVRQIAHGQSSKLIGKSSLLLRLFSFWRNTPAEWEDFYQFFQVQLVPAEFRYFATNAGVQGHLLTKHHGVLVASGVTPDFSGNRATVVIENLQSFYSLTEVSWTQPLLLVWGAGWRVANLVPWLAQLPRPLLYWGDIDKEGLEIYGLLSRHTPEWLPVMMNEGVLLQFPQLIQKKPPYLGALSALPMAEQSLYQRVARSGEQLEQEQLPLAEVVRSILVVVESKDS